MLRVRTSNSALVILDLTLRLVVSCEFSGHVVSYKCCILYCWFRVHPVGVVIGLLCLLLFCCGYFVIDYCD